MEYTHNADALSADASVVYTSEQSAFAGEGTYTRTGSGDNPPVTGTYDADDWRKSLVASGSVSYAWQDFIATVDLSASRNTDLIDQYSEYRTQDGGSREEIVDKPGQY